MEQQAGAGARYTLEAAEAYEELFVFRLRACVPDTAGLLPAISIEVYLPEDWELCHEAAEQLHDSFMYVAGLSNSYVVLSTVDGRFTACIHGYEVMRAKVGSNETGEDGDETLSW